LHDAAKFLGLLPWQVVQLKFDMTRSVIGLYRAILAHSWAAKWNYLLLNCSLRGLGVLNSEDSAVSGEEFLVTHLVPKYLPEAKRVFFDVGANKGDYSALLSKYHPDAKIYAFEPNPSVFTRLQARFGTRIFSVNKGLSSSEDTAPLYEETTEQGSEHASLYKDVIEKIHKSATASVAIQLTSVDKFCADCSIPYISLLKIDTEGHELSVLKGAERMISQKRIGLVQIEFNEMHRVSRCFCEDLLEQLPHHTFYRLLPAGLLPLRKRAIYMELFAFQNLVGIPNNCVPLWSCEVAPV
jgi:FkbM family methyltransferase